MTWNKWVRQSHRWLAIIFTATVVICFVALSGVLPFWVFYLPLFPLFLMMVTGLYMFVLPYTTRRRSGGRAALES
jgi:peptidoglycan/LPS O-acetylase OafA/YrhL